MTDYASNNINNYPVSFLQISLLRIFMQNVFCAFNSIKIPYGSSEPQKSNSII